MVYRPPPFEPPLVHYQDNELLAVEKPSGLLTVPGRGADKKDCLEQRLRRGFPDALVIHRLDMGTSGLVLFARNRLIQRELGELFANRQVTKSYVALVNGVPEPPEGDIDLPLIADWPNRPRQRVDIDHGKPAHTGYETIETAPDGSCSRVTLFPTTGRSHQLRVHMMAIGHPLLGDQLYSDTGTHASRLMLHAWRLSFRHPRSGETLRLHSPVPF